MTAIGRINTAHSATTRSPMGSDSQRARRRTL
jgi:hypothetical protein